MHTLARRQGVWQHTLFCYLSDEGPPKSMVSLPPIVAVVLAVVLASWVFVSSSSWQRSARRASRSGSSASETGRGGRQPWVHKHKPTCWHWAKINTRAFTSCLDADYNPLIGQILCVLYTLYMYCTCVVACRKWVPGQELCICALCDYWHWAIKC